MAPAELHNRNACRGILYGIFAQTSNVLSGLIQADTTHTYLYRYLRVHCKTD